MLSAGAGPHSRQDPGRHLDPASSEIDGSGIGPIGSEDRAEQLGPSPAHQPGDAKNLAPAELEVHLADPLATAETLDPEQAGPDGLACGCSSFSGLVPTIR